MTFQQFTWLSKAAQAILQAVLHFSVLIHNARGVNVAMEAASHLNLAANVATNALAETLFNAAAMHSPVFGFSSQQYFVLEDVILKFPKAMVKQATIIKSFIKINFKLDWIIYHSK